MMRTKLAAALLLPSLMLTGCGGSGETPRSTSNSPNLTGLWRMTVTSAQSNLKADSNISFTLVEGANGLTMTGCDGRSVINVTKSGNTIDGLPNGLVTIVNNDALRNNGEYGNGTASKMATTARFDMGSLQMAAPALGNLNFSDVCVMSTDARVLGVMTQDTISATTLYNGKPLLFDVQLMGNLKVGSFKLAKEPNLGEATLRLQGEGLKNRLNRTELTLKSGTLQITEDGTVRMKGSFSGTMPNGEVLAGNFDFEKP
jgi:hypothetical protein